MSRMRNESSILSEALELDMNFNWIRLFMKQLLVVLAFTLSFSLQAKSEELCGDYVSAYKSADLQLVFDSFMKGINDLPMKDRSRLESKFFDLSNEDKMTTFENVLRFCMSSKPSEPLSGVIQVKL